MLRESSRCTLVGFWHARVLLVPCSLDWRKFFYSSSEQSLEFFPSEAHGGSIAIKPPTKMFDEGIWRWQHSLVAQFLGQPPNFGSLQKLGSGSWPLTHPEQADGAEKLSRVPLELFPQKGFSYIASAFGTPLYMDNITALLQHLAYAKICVEISVDFELPHFINVELRDCSFVSIRSAPDGGATLTSTFEVSSKDEAVVVDLSSTLKLKYICLTGYSNRFEVLNVELKDSNDVVANDIDAEQDVVDDDNGTEQLEFSPQKPRLALLAVTPLVRSLMAKKIWLIWKSACIVDVLYVFGQCLTCSVQVKHKKVFFSAVYACNDGVSRQELWSHLCSMSGQSFTIDMKDFQALVREIEVFDHAYFSHVFTWSNNQLDKPIVKKLDRVLVNAAWFQFLPYSRVKFTALSCSNHCPSIVWLEQHMQLCGWNSICNPCQNLFVKAKAEELESLQLSLLRGDLVRNGHIDQGDPLSPYLFVLVMDVLSRLLDVATINALFKLHLNASKNELFVAGVPQEELALMTTYTGFKVGRLPVRAVGTWSQELAWAILKLKRKVLACCYTQACLECIFLCDMETEEQEIKEILRARLRGRPINRIDPVNVSLCAS
ncbi:Geminivirus AR1/BR1 coat protein [Gossypium australe]|uniref:Geminivirus AR1/BR1 coat protein n=1 Tax=Gossypium australe TaxID=47621 RepID=A0A5B6WPA2_9ROSI|nr:Geminivirus AR1/BR1 coat protein [Gossypium australe]